MIKILISISCLLFCCHTYAAPSLEGIQSYQSGVHTSEERKQNLAEDINRYRHADNIWDVLRDEFSLPHYEDSPQVQEQITWFMAHQDFLIHSATRAAPYLYFIMQQVKKRHLPAELVLLPIIESSYNPFAYSTAGAAGIWQMMPGTATGYGLKRNWWYDGRRDVVASTKAALSYLAYLQSFFDGNWLLATAAYDTGEGNIITAIRKNIRDGKNTDYWSLPIAQETRIYVPRLLALAAIISQPNRYPVDFPSVQNAPYLAQVDLDDQLKVKDAAMLSGLSLKQIMQLNPGYNRATIGLGGPSKIVLPIENVELFSENLAMAPNYRSFDRTEEISQEILESETHPQHRAIAVAKYIPPVSISKSLENFHGHYTMQPSDTLYMVRNKDDIRKISKRFNVSVKTIIAINHLKGSKSLRPGQHIIIPTHLAKSNTRSTYES